MRAEVLVRGKTGEWAIESDLSKSAIDDMRADGLDVIVPENTIPMWVVDLGLMRPWCFVQDVWNFKNPRRQDRPNPPRET